MTTQTRTTISEARALNSDFVASYKDANSGQMQKIASSATDYFRMMARTDGILRSIMPSQTITSADFDRQRDIEDAVVVRSIQGDTAGSFSVPFNGAPQRQTIRAPRYAITIERIITTMYGADEMQIVTYDTPIVEMKTDLMKKDYLAQEDRQFISQIDMSCGPMWTGDNYANVAGSLHYKRAGAAGYLGLSSVSTGQASDAYEARRTIYNLQTSMQFNVPTTAGLNTILMNTVTYELWKFLMDRNTAGGDIAQSFVFDKGEYETLGSAKVVKTLNRNLIADNVIYMFAAPNYLGDFLMYQDITVEIKHDAFFFSFFGHGVEGLGIANIACAKKAKLGGWTGDGAPTWAVTDPA